ncbi:MAG: hypothetical protein A2Y12_05660 [Planctomycetes bacterium GWF2_42_9]|nr:MAG: hypothetical protein A2Y12_05660 [Planctomycetes bacterium GWF2_42_9]
MFEARSTNVRSLVVFSIIAMFLSNLSLQAFSSPVTKILSQKNLWIIPEPKKIVDAAGSFKLSSCNEINLIGADLPSLFKVNLLERLDLKASITLTNSKAPKPQAINLIFSPNGKLDTQVEYIDNDEFETLSVQGYILHIDSNSITIAAKDVSGLFYGIGTLIQIAADNISLPGLHILDWPSLRFRGVQQDVSRGQVPTVQTLKRLIDVLAAAKMNVLELYIEHTFKFKSHPAISPPEGLSVQDANAIFNYGAENHIDVHPFLQVLGHSGHVLNLPQYQHLRVSPCKEKPWIMTWDVRKPESVSMVHELMGDICNAFPGQYLNVDITEIDIDGFLNTGSTQEEVTDLIFNYILDLNNVVKQHGMHLMIAQGPLDSIGHLAGMGPKLDKLPKDILIGMYYTAGGDYKPAWKTDFPRLQTNGFNFFAQPWIDSHIRILPWVSHAMDFSDEEVSRGLAHGAIGSITCDWGDAGHFHLVGQEWYPIVYHGASAWTGANLDRNYFDQAFTFRFYGISDSSVAKAIQLAGNINGQKLKVKDDSGTITEKSSYYFWEFFNNPFTDNNMIFLVDPVEEGNRICKAADESISMLQKAYANASRNKDNIEQLLFGARCYQAMGLKMIMVGHERDSAYSREQLCVELKKIIKVYEKLKADYKNLWLAEDRENDHMHMLISRFDNTIKPCREKLSEINK